jgi:hypothetical protein
VFQKFGLSESCRDSGTRITRILRQAQYKFHGKTFKSHSFVTTQPRNMSLRGALGFAEAVSPYREIASLRQAQDRRRDPEKTSGQASKSPPRNDMPEQLHSFSMSSVYQKGLITAIPNEPKFAHPKQKEDAFRAASSFSVKRYRSTLEQGEQVHHFCA